MEPAAQAALPTFPPELKPALAQTSPATQAALPMGFARGEAAARPTGDRPEAISIPVPPIEIDSRRDIASQAKGSPAQTAASPSPPPGAVPLLDVPLRLVGVVGRLYVVLESDRGLVLLDQHAAHERVLFEQMLNRLEQHDYAHSQKLLLPETVELSARDANFLREQLPVLTRLGVGLSEFGERTGQQVNTLRLGEQMIAKTVCRHAVKANDPLAGAELEKLIADLRRCAMPYTCPHGRPTLVEMNFRELEKKFGRTQ
jgi:DNA mismatch repair protein MutL